ncbi:MAG: type II toxin-antitoxin system VapC family toxin [Gemmataceae bacterium]|nr:type II toxin-antitoxin system VapC family toxin [Gemmataceae bacterium]
MKPRVYIETTVPSYLTARPSRQLVRAAQQQLTRDWWAEQRPNFELVTSQLTWDECGRGDPTAAADRLAVLAGIPQLLMTGTVDALIRDLIAGMQLPNKAIDDATHVAVAAVHTVDYLLTWNCTHLANPVLARRVDAVCRVHGYRTPLIRTPGDFPLTGNDHERG